MLGLVKKYLLTGTAVTVLVALVIFWGQVYLERTSKSLSGRVVSQSSLQPESTSSLPGLRVTVDGVTLERPYLTVIEIKNSGTRPIQTSDFEADIELKINTEARVVRSQVASVQPQDLDLKIAWERESIKISPLLLNPGDVFSVSILSADDKPVFIPRVRIAGVGKLELDEVSWSAKPSRFQFISAFFAFALLIVAGLTTPSFSKNDMVQLTRKAAIFVSVTCIIIAVFTIGPVFEWMGLQGLQLTIAIILFSMSVTTFSFLWSSAKTLK